MKISSRGYLKYVIGFLILLICSFSLIYLMKSGESIKPTLVEAKIIEDRIHPEIEAAVAVHGRHTHTLMNIPAVVGTAVGLTEAGKPSILVFLKERIAPGILPDSLEGLPVVAKVTGEIFAMKPPLNVPVAKINPKAWFTRPVPIGVSTGNAGECSAGTIGARVKDSAGKVYALSNNHVYALENKASIGSKVLQPGLYDTKCVFSEKNVIGTLYAFEPIVFSTSVANVIDAAIALSSTDLLNNSTPNNGYGTPKSDIVSPTLNQLVQKYGRTTGLTKGTITAINATINVTYSSGTARFVNQIVVQSSKPFIKPGDSGSLLVTDPDCNPVGLLFAGDSSGKYAIANPIDEVLNRFGVTIDGE